MLSVGLLPAACEPATQRAKSGRACKASCRSCSKQAKKQAEKQGPVGPHLCSLLQSAATERAATSQVAQSNTSPHNA